MNKEKLAQMTKYAESIKSKMQDPRTDKQKRRLVEYNRFLANELSTTLAKIEAAKMDGVK